LSVITNFPSTGQAGLIFRPNQKIWLWPI